MSKSKNSKRIKLVPFNQYRKIAMWLNPALLVVMVVALILGVPFEFIVGFGVVGYGVWLFFFIKANQFDNKTYGKKR
jgi:lipopolysaccharide export LptBFGC system permease protein LptF